MKKKVVYSCIATLLSAPVIALAGPYAPAAGVVGSTAIQMNDASILGWASSVVDYQVGTGVDAQWTNTANALGQAEGTSFDVVSLGTGGQITLGFDNPIMNGAGYDFAVFENSFSNTFLELAWVEVSSNGADFFRFPGFSLTESAVGSYGSVDPTNIDGLAGKYRQAYGTQFDLDILSGLAGIDINNIGFVRLVDIVGDGTVFDDTPAQVYVEGYGWVNTGGPNPIYDPYPSYGSAGFDLDAIGVIHQSVVPVPAAVWLMGSGLLGLFGVARVRRA